MVITKTTLTKHKANNIHSLTPPLISVVEQCRGVEEDTLTHGSVGVVRWEGTGGYGWLLPLLVFAVSLLYHLHGLRLLPLFLLLLFLGEGGFSRLVAMDVAVVLQGQTMLLQLGPGGEVAAAAAHLHEVGDQQVLQAVVVVLQVSKHLAPPTLEEWVEGVVAAPQ